MNQWSTQLPNITTTGSTLRTWLTDPSSTTKKFETAGITASYHLQKTPLSFDALWPDFLCDDPLSRTVKIQIMGHTFIHASSFISAKQALKINIQTLGNRPLGPLLFAEKDLIRSPFLYSQKSNQTIQRISQLKSKNLKCILVEAFNINHPLFNKRRHG